VIKFLIAFTLGLLIGIVYTDLVYKHIGQPEVRDQLESAYYLGCIQGVDDLIQGNFTIKTCSDLKYNEERK